MSASREPSVEPKPCPICGSSVRISDLGGWEVLCNDNSCGMLFELPDERNGDRAATIEAWNRRAPSEPGEVLQVLRELRKLIANDAYAITFQTFWQYRSSLLKCIDSALAAQGEPK